MFYYFNHFCLDIQTCQLTVQSYVNNVTNDYYSNISYIAWRCQMKIVSLTCIILDK